MKGPSSLDSRRNAPVGSDLTLFAPLLGLFPPIPGACRALFNHVTDGRRGPLTRKLEIESFYRLDGILTTTARVPRGYLSGKEGRYSYMNVSSRTFISMHKSAARCRTNMHIDVMPLSLLTQTPSCTANTYSASLGDLLIHTGGICFRRAPVQACAVLAVLLRQRSDMLVPSTCSR